MTQAIAELSKKLDLILDDPSRRRWLRFPHAADYCGLSVETLRRMVSSGKLTAHRPARGVVILDRHELDSVISSATATPRKGRGRN